MNTFTIYHLKKLVIEDIHQIKIQIDPIEDLKETKISTQNAFGKILDQYAKLIQHFQIEY